ncbi:MAG: hypothetical protein NWF03_01710 [Candidatus Bathyarchaeota archaeon]|nr:hypothetical protein [Candidatus Bathyarchaeota archaeon]
MMTKKQLAVVVFCVCLICSIVVILWQTAPSTIEEEPQSDLPYSVISSEYSGVSYDLYCPDNSSGSLVIFAGGILGHKYYLAGWAPILAEKGYAVLTFSTPPEDLDHVPRYVSNCKSNIEKLLPFVFNASEFPISINEDCVSLVGMSGGGATVLTFDDPRIETTVAICPYYISNSSVHNHVPVLIITGSNDTICPHDTHGLAYYNELNPNKMIIEQADVGHDMSTAGWTCLISWLEHIENSEDFDLSDLQEVEDTAILFSSQEFFEPSEHDYLNE